MYAGIRYNYQAKYILNNFWFADKKVVIATKNFINQYERMKVVV